MLYPAKIYIYPCLIESMVDAKKVVIKGKQLKCSFCGNDGFYELNVRVNTFATTFFSGILSFFARGAKAYVCSNCGKKEEFVQN